MVCPWLPDVRPAATGDIADYARFVVDTLLPRVRAETPAVAMAEATGIDGVSLTAVSRAWAAAGIAHDFADLPGPHDYVFNRGPVPWTFCSGTTARSRGVRAHPGLAQGTGVVMVASHEGKNRNHSCAFGLRSGLRACASGEGGPEARG